MAGSVAAAGSQTRWNDLMWKSGHMATIRDIAEAAGVSKSTVSLVLNDSPRISAPTQRKVRLAMKQKGFIPNPYARALRKARVRTVGVLVTDLANSAYTDMLKGAHSVLDGEGYCLFVSDTEDSVAQERRQVLNLLARGVDGLLISPATDGDGSQHEWLQAKGLAIVLMNRRYENAPFDAVVPDNAAGAAQVTRHLLDLGRRPIIHIVGPHGNFTGRARREAWAHTLMRAGIPAATVSTWTVEIARLTMAAGYKASRRILQRFRPPFSLFAVNDMVAMGFRQFAREHGLRIPEDVALAGFDSQAMLEALGVPLTSVRVRFDALGRTAAETLLRRVSAKCRMDTGRTVLMPAELVVRQSTCG